MSLMVDRVERALKAFDAVWLLDTGCTNPSGPKYEEARARAVIAAMLSPTEAMCRAGIKELRSDTGPGAYEIWRAMIDEALK